MTLPASFPSLDHPACGVTFHGSTAGRASSPSAQEGTDEQH
jgi:hypothetical protein